jgi:hypothetical protein
MKRERIVEFAGGGDEDIAYLRLVLRKAAQQLDDKWRLRREDDSHVDLLVIEDIADPSLPVARGADLRFVRLIDPHGASGIQTVAWPLSQDLLTRLFNLIGSTGFVSRAPPGPAIQQNIYDDLFEPNQTEHWHAGDEIAAQFSDFSDGWLARPDAAEAKLVQEAEHLFRNDPRVRHKEVVQAFQLHDNIGVEATEGHTEGTGSRKDRRGVIAFGSDTPATSTLDDTNAHHLLAAYLSGKLLPGPARIEVNYIVLTLDPRNRQYYARGSLCVFEDCCTRPLKRGDWKLLSAGDFAEVKKQFEARPFSELQWLCAYLDEAAAAASALAVDKPCRLSMSFDLQRDYPRAARVAKALEAGSTLTAAAAAARVTVADAKRIAYAFDRIGFLEAE